MSKISNFDYKMFDAARKVAHTSDFDVFHVGCVIVYKKHIIASAANTNKTNPTQKKYNRKYRKFNKGKGAILDKGHAEICALKSIPYPLQQSINWKEVKVYIFRVCRGKPLGQGLSRPCPSCLAAIKDYGIQNIYYTTDEGYCHERLV